VARLRRLFKGIPGFEISSWIAMGAPKHTSSEIIERLNKEITAGLADPKIVARLADLGASAFTASPIELEKLVVDETEKWGKVVRAANIKAE
jgi:tripartite-type tricarboxylate transporter receptor subunit TctC